jgi:hypothetical protein
MPAEVAKESAAFVKRGLVVRLHSVALAGRLISPGEIGVDSMDMGSDLLYKEPR